VTPVEEPIVEAGEIQGDVLAGFRKDHAILVFLHFDASRRADIRRWIAKTADRVSYVDAVHAFNTAFRHARRHLGADPPMTATWLNIAFTFDGLQALVPDLDVDVIDERRC